MSLLRLNPTESDISAKMPLRLDKDGPILKTNEEEPREGYIEFWADDAAAAKSKLKPIQTEVTRYAFIQQKRTTKDIERLSSAALEREIREITRLNLEGLAVRVKSWLLVNEAGEIVDLPVTKETAMEVFSDEGLRAYATDWLENNADAFLPTKKPSYSSSPKPE